jgi:hypothetical protein
MSPLSSPLGAWAASGGEAANARAIAAEAYRRRRIVCINLDWPMAPADRETLAGVAERVLFERRGG